MCGTVLQGHLHGIAVVENGKMAGLKADPIAWLNDVKKHIALCHDLVQLPKNRIAGQQDERRAFAAVEAVFTVHPHFTHRQQSLVVACIQLYVYLPP